MLFVYGMESDKKCSRSVRRKVTHSEETLSQDSNVFLFLGIVALIAIAIAAVARATSHVPPVRLWTQARKGTIELIKDNPKLAAERNKELHGFWGDTVSDRDELEKRRDTYAGQESKLTRAFQIEAAEFRELPQDFYKVDVTSSPNQIGAESRWRASKESFLLTALESLLGPRWSSPRVEEWLSTRISDLSAMIDREIDAYLDRQRPKFQLTVFFHAIDAAATFHGACEMSKWFIRQHARNLATRRSQLISRDIYGVGDSSKWQQEKAYFFSKVMLPTLGFVDGADDEESRKTKVALATDLTCPIESRISNDYKDSDRLRKLFIDLIETQPRDVLHYWYELFPVECRRLVITEMVSPRLGDLVSDWIEKEVARCNADSDF